MLARSKRRPCEASTRLEAELLEDRRLLAIVWANSDPSANGFDAEFGADAGLATAIVRRAVSDWERAVVSFNYDVDTDADPNNDLDDTFTLTVSAGAAVGRASTLDVSYGADDRPFAATITLDDDATGEGWYFDPSPLDDAEFAAAVAPFEASFIDAAMAGQAALRDFYHTVLHEIGHALGIGLIDTDMLDSGLYPYYDAAGAPVTNPNPANASDPIIGTLTHRGVDQEVGLRVISDPDGVPSSGDETYAMNELWEYQLAGGDKVTFTEAGGGHLYAGAPDPSHTGITTHEHDLMIDSPAASGSPAAVTRRFISDTAIDLLSDAFGYTATSPVGAHDVAPQDFSAGVAQISFEPHGGTLLVQGLYWDPTSASASHVDDSISLTKVGSDVRAAVSYTLDDGASHSFTRDIALDRVQQIIVAGNGGTDTIMVASGLAGITHQVDYVVTSNQDANESGTLGDGFVDLDATQPGAQVTLRAALRDADNLGGAGAVYLPPSPRPYTLTLTGAESSSGAFNDLDVSGEVALYGAGAGLSVVDASGISDRVIHVRGGGELLLSRLTITGGAASGGGAGVMVDVGADAALVGVAVVGNSAGSSGGGLLALSNAGASPGQTNVSIHDSVFTGNTSSQYGGGVRGAQSGTIITVGATVIAGNAASLGAPNFDLALGATGQSDGDNLIGTYSGSFFNASGDLTGGSPDFIVTSIADQYDSSDNGYALTLREAIDQANDASGADEVWLPAWSCVLTLQRTTQPTDIDAAYGDLDILGDLTVRRAGSLSDAVRWADSTVTDKTFELLGDYSGNLVVDSADYYVWLSHWGSSGSDPDEWENLTGDGDDDDDVDATDRSIWLGNYGAELDLFGVS